MQNQKKELQRGLLPHTIPPAPFNYGYFFTSLKQTHHIGMELQKKIEQV